VPRKYTIKLAVIFRLILLGAIAPGLSGCMSASATKAEKLPNPFEGYSTEEILLSGDQALQAKEYDRALFVYMQALQIEETADTWYRVGVTKIRLDDKLFAWRSFSAAVELDPEHVYSYEELGLLSMGFGQPEQAMIYFTKATELDATRWRSYNAMGVMADVDKRYAEAVVFYKAAFEGNPGSAMLMNNIGYSYYLAGSLQDATDWFDTAMQAQANYEPAIKNLALLYARQGWYDDAVQTFKKVVDAPLAYNDTGYVAMRNGDLEEASQLLAEAIRLAPKYYELAYQNLEQVKAEQHRKALRIGDDQGGSADDPLNASNISEIIFPDNHDQKYRKVMPQALNVRSAPSSDAEIVNYLRTGNRVEVLVSQPGWAFISHKTRSGGVIKGWVSTRFLDPDAVEVSDYAGDKAAAPEAPLATVEEAPLVPVDPSEQLLQATLEAANN